MHEYVKSLYYGEFHPPKYILDVSWSQLPIPIQPMKYSGNHRVSSEYQPEKPFFFRFVYIYSAAAAVIVTADIQINKSNFP